MIVLVVVGALAGWVAFAVGRTRPALTPRMEWLLPWLLPGVVAVGGPVLLSILESIVGPW
ncbi:MAG: hypothetical protein Q8W51_09425 [Candidatus Palauibacterales bacterium]|nr:hypothetical protein [Candidatus Palauibacterales bacterium]MDP2583368.1 hypothetical protein [Candidatus Palauibacterales bacterium]